MDPSGLAASIAEEPVVRETDLLVLYGSRARGDDVPSSDWDVGYLGAVDPAALVDTVSRLLGTDAVDVVDLSRASALLRFRAARDGIVLYEDQPERFLAFQDDAVRFWCDAGPVIRAAQAEVLAELG